jgi:hypothetical protein
MEQIRLTRRLHPGSQIQPPSKHLTDGSQGEPQPAYKTVIM